MASSTPSIIAPDVVIEGNIKTESEIQLDGTIMGDLSCGSVVMGETGSVKGVIVADTVTIRGKVDGEIRARTVRLEKTAVIEGDVYQEILSVESGAVITGRFSHSVNGTAKKEATSDIPSFVKTEEPAAAE